jgi:anti-sigma factor RsiW
MFDLSTLRDDSLDKLAELAHSGIAAVDGELLQLAVRAEQENRKPKRHHYSVEVTAVVYVYATDEDNAAITAEAAIDTAIVDPYLHPDEDTRPTISYGINPVVRYRLDE